MAVKNNKFMILKYFKTGATGSGNSAEDQHSYDAAGTITLADVLEAGMVVERVDLVLKTAIATATVITVGDEDAVDTFIDADDVTEATPAVYTGDGAKKYYAADQNLRIVTTGTPSAGEFVVAVHGYKV